MLIEATATRFQQQIETGRNKPVLISAVDGRNHTIEVVLKYSAGNKELGIKGLISESIAALIAGDLGLHIPHPYIIKLTPEFITSVQASTPVYAKLLSQSCPIAYACCHLKGYKVVSQAWQPPAELLLDVAEIAAFDAIIQNPDRKPDNPNCLQNGQNIAIIDHELAFTHLNLPIIGFRNPWIAEALENFLSPQNYLFGGVLRKFNTDFARFKKAWKKITDERLDAYLRHLPSEWVEGDGSNFAGKIIKYVQEARENLDACLAEIRRATRG